MSQFWLPELVFQPDGQTPLFSIQWYTQKVEVPDSPQCLDNPMMFNKSNWHKRRLCWCRNILQGACPCLPPSHLQGACPCLPPSNLQGVCPCLPPSHLQGACPCLPPSHLQGACPCFPQVTYRERALACPQVTYRERALACPQVTYRERALACPQVTYRERALACPQVTYRERALACPQVTYRERALACPQVTVLRHMVVPRPWLLPQFCLNVVSITSSGGLVCYILTTHQECAPLTISCIFFFPFLAIPNHIFKIVVEVNASGQPHVLELWLGWTRACSLWDTFSPANPVRVSWISWRSYNHHKVEVNLATLGFEDFTGFDTVLSVCLSMLSGILVPQRLVW